MLLLMRQMSFGFYFRENFLQLDIYYNQLSIEEVVQQPAFEFLSLLSEIGGFLGLLLGASVLTLCEVFDFIIINSLAACKGRKKKPEMTEKELDEQNDHSSSEIDSAAAAAAVS